MADLDYTFAGVALRAAVTLTGSPSGGPGLAVMVAGFVLVAGLVETSVPH